MLKQAAKSTPSEAGFLPNTGRFIPICNSAGSGYLVGTAVTGQRGRVAEDSRIDLSRVLGLGFLEWGGDRQMY